MPDHSQNKAVSNTISQPPNVANKIKNEKKGGDSICARHIQRQSKTKAVTPRNGTTKLTPTAAMTFESGITLGYS